MAVYTDIADTALEHFLEGYPLGRALSFKGIAEGVENSNYLLETERGRFILTLYERRVRAADLPYFLALMEWLARQGFPSARPVARRDGAALGELAGRPAAIITFLPGLAATRPTLPQQRAAGEGLAWLHLAAESFPERRANDLGQSSWAALAAPLAGAADLLEPGLGRAMANDLAVIAAAWPRALPRGVIHADWFPDNVFFRGAAFAGAIDFYFAADDALAYDLGVALNAWAFTAEGRYDSAAAAELVAGYESRRPLSAEERRALPLLARGAALRFFLTRLADWGARREGALVRPKDPLEYAARLSFHRSGGLKL
jgi:homoserine kinase type II